LSCSARVARSMPRPSRLCSCTTRVTRTPGDAHLAGEGDSLVQPGRLAARDPQPRPEPDHQR
jgi:hypothetical protein